MNRIPHILKDNKGTQQPNNIIWVDTETKHHLSKDRDQYHFLWFGWACYQRREEGEKWSKPEWFRFTTLEAFWDWVETKTRKKTRLYMFAHNGVFDLPVLGAFSEMPDRGYKLHNAIADCPPLVLVWKKESRTIRFVDTLNIWRMPLSELGNKTGHHKIAMPLPSAPMSDWDAYGKQDVEIIRVAVLDWLTFLRDNDLGGFASTLASQAFNTYRHRFMPTAIFITDRKEALALDRESYVGGRTECNYIGEYHSDFYLVDVHSMYPSVMFAEEYPVKLLGTYDDVTFKEMERWLETKAVVAQVEIETEEPIYPIVYEGKLVFPVGTFWCTLAGPELDYALLNGNIKTLGTANVYVKAKIFESFVAFMYLERRRVFDCGDLVSYWLFKILMNSLYGKFGQRGRRWVNYGTVDNDIIETWDEIDAETGKITRWRRFGGLEQTWVDDGESRESFPAIASYVTSYARLKIWQAMKLAGQENWYYCDTDSLLLNQKGFDNIQSLLHESALGMWGLEKRLSRIVLHGPKDYEFDDMKTVKGVKKNAEWLSDNTVRQDMFVGFNGMLNQGNLSYPIVKKIIKTQKRIYTKGIVQPNGKVLPFRFPLEK